MKVNQQERSILFMSMVALFLLAVAAYESKASSEVITEELVLEHKEEVVYPDVPDFLTDDQYSNLLIAREVGKEENLSLTLMSICMQETHCGEIGPVGHKSVGVGLRSYGLLQIKVSAARDVLKVHPELGEFDTDEELISKLLTDNWFNMTVGKEYFKLLKKRGMSWREAVTAYNLGPTGVKSVDATNYKYTNKVIAHMKHGVVAKLENYL